MVVRNSELPVTNFITSLRADADLFLKTAREHWGWKTDST